MIADRVHHIYYIRDTDCRVAVVIEETPEGVSTAYYFATPSSTHLHLATGSRSSAATRAEADNRAQIMRREWRTRLPPYAIIEAGLLSLAIRP